MQNFLFVIIIITGYFNISTRKKEMTITHGHEEDNDKLTWMNLQACEFNNNDGEKMYA